MHKKILFFALALIICAGSVFAQQTITQTKNFTGNPGYSRSLVYDQFNPALGTLTSIQIIFNMNTSGGYLSVDNDGDTPASTTVELGATGRISSSDVPLVNGSFQPIGSNLRASTGQTFSLGPEDGDGPGNVDPSPDDGATHSGGSDSDTDTDNVNAAVFGDYTGTGSYTVTMEASSIIDFGGVGGVEGSFGPPVVGGDLTIIYTYTPFTSDLSLTKSVSNATPDVGDNITYTITVTNSGPDDAAGVAVEDVLPSGVTYQSDNSGGDFNSSNGTWTIGSLANGASTSIQITAQVTGTGSITNSAQVSASDYDDPDSTPGNSVPSEDDQDSAGITVPAQVDLELDKNVNNSNPPYGSTIAYTVTVTNTSPYDNATGVTVSDVLPAGLSFVSSSGDGAYNQATGVWTVGSVAANSGSKTLTINATVTGTGTIENFAQVSSCDQDDADSTPGNGDVGEDDDDKVSITVAPSADLRLTKSVNNSTPGLSDNIIYTITVYNDGPDNATNVQVEDILPASVSYQSDNSGGDFNSTTGIWTVGSLANGASASIQVTAQVTGTGSITNTAQVHASDQYDPDSTPGNDTPSEDDQDNSTISVPPRVDLELEKSVNTANPPYGSTITYTLTVRNTSSYDDATGVQVTDILPGALSYISSSGDGTYNQATGVWTVGGVPANNGSKTITITASVNGTGSIENFAQVTACGQNDADSTPDNGDVGEDDDDKTTITVSQSADLRLSKTASTGTPNLNDNVTFTVTVYNDGPDNTTNVTVKDVLPAGITFQSDNSGGSFNSTTGIWSVGSLANGASASVQITGKVTATGTITNTAQVQTSDLYDYDSTPGNSVQSEDDQDSATLTVPRIVDLHLEKTVNNSTPNMGDAVQFTITVTNDGPDPASGITVKDVLGSDFTYDSDNSSGAFNSGTGIWTVGSLASGSSASIQITAVVAATGSIENTAQVQACDDNDTDSTPGNSVPSEDDQDSASLTVAPSADLALEKTVNSGTAHLNDNVVFSITLTNSGPDNATGVSVRDLLPAGLSFVSVSADNGSYNETTGIWSVGSLNNGSQTTLSITAAATQSGTLANTAQVSASDQYDPDSTPDNNAPAEDDQDNASVTVPSQADLRLTKSVNTPNPAFGDNVVYTVTVYNDGPDGAANVEVEDILPASMTYQSDNSGGDYNSTTGIWTVGSLANGTDATIQITAQVAGTGTIDNTAQVHASSQYDPDSTPDNDAPAEDDQDNASVSVDPLVDLELEKTVNNANPNYGSSVIFTLTVTNTLPYNNATGVTVTDMLPAGLTYVSASGDGTYNQATGLWTVGEVAAGNGSKSLTINAQVNSTGSMENTAEVTACDQEDRDSTPGNSDTGEDDYDTASVSVGQSADLRLDKSVALAPGSPSPVLNADIVYTISVYNDGPDNATNVEVEDILPTGAAYQSDNSGGAYNSATGIWTVGSLANGAGATLEITARIAGTNVIDNTAQVHASDQYDPDSTPDNDISGEDDQDNADITIPPVVDLELNKSVDNSHPPFGSSIAFTLSLENKSAFNDDATGVEVTDVLPAGLDFVSASGDGSYDQAAGVWTVGNVAANAGAKTLTINAQVNTTGSVQNFAQVSACDQYDIDSTPDNGDADEDDDDTASVSVDESADLRLEKSIDKSVTILGDTVTFTLLIHNSGPDKATNVKAMDYLPNGFEVISSQGQGNFHSSNGLWKVGDIGAYEDAVMTVSVKINTTGRKTNIAEITEVDQYDPDSTPNNHVPAEDDYDVASVNIPLVTDIELDKSADKDTVMFKDQVNFSLTVTNTSDLNDATGVTVKDTLPEGFSYVSSTGTGTYNPSNGIWTVGSVAKNGGSAQIIISARADSTGSFENRAEIWACNEYDLDSTPANNSTDEDDDDLVSLFVPEAADLELEKSIDAGQQYVQGEAVFTLTLFNRGPDTGTGITVTDLLPRGVAFSAAAGDGSYNAETGIWTVGSMERGARKIMTITTVLSDSAAEFVNTAQVSTADQYDPDSTPGNSEPEEDDQDSAGLTAVPVSDLRLDKQGYQDTVEIGTEALFRLSVYNDGPNIATGVKVRDQLPRGMAYLSHSSGSYDPVTGVWNIGTLAVNDSAVITLTCTASDTGLIHNSAQVSASDNHDPDSTPDNSKPDEDDQDDAHVFVIAGSIGDEVWFDTNENGIKDSGEAPVQGVIIRLIHQGRAVAADTTDSMGLYLFTSLASGSYIVDVDDATLPARVRLTTGNDPMNIELKAGEQRTDADFGYAAPSGSIGDEVWKDTDGNGTRSTDETEGLAGVRVMLKNVNGSLIAETRTDESGLYTFTSLESDTFLVQLDQTTLPLGYSTTTGSSHKVFLENNQNYTEADFGAMYVDGNVGSIGDYVWKDINRNGLVDPGENPGISGVEVLLLDGSGNEIDRDTTDADGCYRFQGLAAGSYIVDVNTGSLPDTWVLTTDNNPMPVTIAAGEDYSKADFGFMEVAQNVGVIGDYTWHDMNWNANQDPDESSLSYITVFLYKDGSLLKTARTNFFGRYLFTNLAPGSYWVKACTRGPLPPGSMREGYNGGDSPEPWEMTTADSFYVELKGGEVYRNADFGFAYPSEDWGAGDKKVFAMYQPWYTGADNDSTLRYWDELFRGGHADTSRFGQYDCTSPDLAEYHILSAWSSGIDGFVVDWYGRSSLENRALRIMLDKAADLYAAYGQYGFDFQIALSYNEAASGSMGENFTYIADSLFTHAAYLNTRQGLRRPLFIGDTGLSRFYAAEYRDAASRYLPTGTMLIWNEAYAPAFGPVDAVYPLAGTDSWDPDGNDWGEGRIDYTYSEINTDAARHDLTFAVGGVWPGYDDRPWSLGENRFMSRRDTLTYDETWNKVHQYVDNTLFTLPMPWCLIQSWNDFNRATEIEPTTEWGYRFNKLTRRHIRRFKGSNHAAGNDLALITPEYIFRARKAAALHHEHSAEISSLIQNAVNSFFTGQYEEAVSYADMASGLSISRIDVEKTGSGTYAVSWEAAKNATGYIVYYSADSTVFSAAHETGPYAVPVGNTTRFCLQVPDPASEYYIAVTAVDTCLGPWANEGWYCSSLYNTGVVYTGESFTAVANSSGQRPEAFILGQNFPNPFNPETAIQFALPRAQHVVLQVFDIQGRLIETLVDSRMSAGMHTVSFNGMYIPSGIYFYRMRTQSFSAGRRMILVK